MSLVALAGLAGCKTSWFEAREPWRREAEEQCLKSGSVKESPAIAMLRPIQGPGMCGADFPLKVVAFGENEPMAYTGELRPPGSVPLASPSLSAPATRPSYGTVAAPAQRSAPVSLDPTSGGSNTPTYYPSIEREPLDAPRMDGGYQPSYQSRPYETQRAPSTSRDIVREEPRDYSRDTYRGTADPRGDDYDDDPPQRPAYPASRSSNPPDQRAPYGSRIDAPRTTAPAPSPRISHVPLGPSRRPIQATATVTPAATLACPIVSALDGWIRDSIQPAANRWFNQPVVEIKQISAYSCRGMNGQPGARIFEHAFGNALDIAAFVLADGRKVTVQYGWRGSPEEQGFLRDIQAAACERFNTVLAPGSNAFHYDHIHVDLMRRSSGMKICNPDAVSGEDVAARAQSSGPAFARSQDRYQRPYERAPQRDLIAPGNDPFAWRGAARRDTTGSVPNPNHAKQSPPSRRAGPVDDENILSQD